MGRDMKGFMEGDMEGVMKGDFLFGASRGGHSKLHSYFLSFLVRAEDYYMLKSQKLGVRRGRVGSMGGGP